MTDLWNDLLRAALLGSERVPLSTDQRQQLLQLGLSANAQPAAPATSRLADDEAATLLQAGFGLQQMQRAGYMPPILPPPASHPAPEEDHPVCSPRAVQVLHLILQAHRPLLSEYVTHLTQAQQRLPEELLPLVLEIGSTKPELWPALRRIVGERGEWLAAQNPDWHYLLVNYDPDSWQTGTRPQRLSLLQHWRRIDPDAALQMLSDTWDTESTTDKLAFLKALRIHLNASDLPLLEQAAQHSRQEVRLMAHHLLTQIPEAAYTQQLFQRLITLLTLKRGLLRQSLTVQLPNDTDKILLQDFKPKDLPNEGGERGALLARLILAAPLDQLAAHYGCTPKQWLKLCWQSDWRTLLTQATFYAIRRQANAEWAEAAQRFWMNEVQLSPHADALDVTPLLAVSTPAAFDRLCSEALASSTNWLPETHIAFQWMLRHQAHWSKALSQVWAQHLLHILKHNPAFWSGMHYRSLIDHAAYYIEPTIALRYLDGPLDAPRQTLSYWQPILDQFTNTLHLRSNMHRSFTAQ